MQGIQVPMCHCYFKDISKYINVCQVYVNIISTNFKILYMWVFDYITSRGAAVMNGTQ